MIILMENDVQIPDLPGYITVKEATKILGVSDTRVYFYIEKGRLHAVWAGNNLMIPLEEITKLKATIQPPGRPRRNTPLWRISSGENAQFTTQITVAIRPQKQTLFEQKLEELRENKRHLSLALWLAILSAMKRNPNKYKLSWSGVER